MNQTHCLILVVLSIACLRLVTATNTLQQPNIVFIVGDDVGVGDLSCYGHPSQEWGAIDKMAAQGIRFTQAYSAGRFCTPSRAAFLTGRLPQRTGLVGPDVVLHLSHTTGLPHSEVTVAEALRDAGYRTGMVGKWHLGVNAYSHSNGSNLPHTHGFDYVGTFLPFTLLWECDTEKRHLPKPSPGRCLLYRNTSIVQQPIRLDNLTAQLVMDAKGFLYDSAQHVQQGERKPFFFYFSFPQTHAPMFNEDRFRGKSKRGVYGDQVNEMAWAVGEIFSTLEDTGMDKDTLTVFISDHGPHIQLCEEGGSAGFFRGGKGFLTEGGMRVPVIARWPGVIPAGIVDATVISLMDLFPTFLSLAGTSVPQDRHIDGRDLSKILFASDATVKDPHHDILYFYCDNLLMAVRYGHYKIYFHELPFPGEETLRSRCRGTFPLVYTPLRRCHLAVPMNPIQIYNVDADPRESFPLPVEDFQETLQQVHGLLDKHKETLMDLPEPLLKADFRTSRVIPCCNYPYCVC